MSVPFRKPAQSFAAPPPDTPYRRAQQEWDARMGSAVLSARAWRALAFASLALAALMGLSLTGVALQKRTFVHVVEVDPQGQVMNVRVADGRWNPSEAEIAAQLGRFIRLVRSLPTDGVVLREQWMEAYRFLTPQAAAHLTQIAREDDPFLLLGHVGRTVQVRSILARSDQSWEINWTEHNTNETGATDPQTFTGVFTVTTRPPANADDIAVNPLGILISDFSWSRVR
jgi:type IV secretion system protein VirB5